MAACARWRETWAQLGAAADEGLYREVTARYREPHRKYHTLEHLAHCFERFDEARAFAVRPAEVELALWFHDAVYDPARDDNEARSADWARAAARAKGVPPPAADRVHALILATRHDALPEDPDARLVADVDLAILGAEPARFDEYERRIREEHAATPDPRFRRERSALLRRFLARPRIYSTAYFRDRYERRARANITRSLNRLERA